MLPASGTACMLTYFAQLLIWFSPNFTFVHPQDVVLHSSESLFIGVHLHLFFF